MSRKHHYRKKTKEPPELEITTFLNLMVVLVPFLLITAVFSRITIMELNVPVGVGAGSADAPKFVLEVIVRKQGLEIGNGQGVVASIAKNNNEYDIAKLSEYLQEIKKNYPDKEDATVLMEPDLEYEYLILVMDAVRSAEIKTPDAEEKESGSNELVDRIILFPNISVGDAP